MQINSEKADPSNSDIVSAKSISLHSARRRPAARLEQVLVDTGWAVMEARNWQSADWFEENDSMGGELSVPLNLGQK